jgi:peptidoglycan/xylan/chitin deacetylase (PgdA/CDA1 family)
MAHVAHRAIAGLAAALAASGALAGCAVGSDEPAPRRTAATTPAPAVLPGPAAQRAAVQRLARLGRPVYCGAGTRRLVALTFDDGPGRYTPIMLRQLHDAGARATFFLVGKSIDRFPQTPRLQRQQHAIGEHSMTHANLRTLSPAAATAEIAAGKAKALAAAGEPVDLFRPPYGSRTTAIDREVSRQGMAQILWDVDSTDSRNTPPARFHEISARVRKHARPGSIVLMHENRGQTIRAMRSILPALKRRHLKLVTVPELLAADPPSEAQLAKGVRGCKAGPAARRR